MTQPLLWMGTGFAGDLNGIGIQQLYIYGSYDGLDWVRVGLLPAYVPSTGQLLRDPTFLWSNASGTWTCFVAHTYLSPTMAPAGGVAQFLQGTSFGVIKSTDLLNWTHVADIDCSALIGTTPTVPDFSYWPAPAWGSFTCTGISSGTLFSHIAVPGGMPFAIPGSTTLRFTLNGQTVVTQAGVTNIGATSIVLSTTYTAAGNTGTGVTSPAGVYPLGGQTSFGGNTYCCVLAGGTGTNPTVDTAHWSRRTACWGPQWFVDPLSGNIYVFMQLNIQDICAYLATDTVGFSTFDTGTRVIDADGAGGFPSTNYATSVIKVGSTYHMWASTLTSSDPLAVANQGTWHATSSNLLSGYTYQALEFGAMEGAMVVFDGTLYRIYGDHFPQVSGTFGIEVATTASVSVPVSWSAATKLTMYGGLAQQDYDGTQLGYIREGAYRPIGVPGAPDYNTGPLAVFQALPTFPPRVGVGGRAS